MLQKYQYSHKHSSDDVDISNAHDHREEGRAIMRSVLQTTDQLIRGVKAVLSEAVQDNVTYLEMMVRPYDHVLLEKTSCNDVEMNVLESKVNAILAAAEQCQDQGETTICIALNIKTFSICVIVLYCIFRY